MEVKEFLKQAKEVLTKVNDKEKELRGLKSKENSLEKSLSNLEKKQTDCIKKTQKDKREELLKYFEALYIENEKNIKEKKEVREKEKSEKIKKLVEEGIAGLKDEYASIKQELKDKIKEAGLPFFINNKIFYSLFAPTLFTDYLLFFFIFIGLTIALPYYLYIHFKFKDLIWLFVFIILAIFIFGVVIVLIHNLLINNKQDELDECLKTRKELKKVKKEIKKASKKIRNGITDDALALDSYDYDINKLKEELKSLMKQKDSALKTFEEETTKEIESEVIYASKKDFDEIQDKIIASKNEIKDVEDALSELKKDFQENYEKELGKDLIDVRVLTRLIDKLNETTETIETIQDAKKLLK